MASTKKATTVPVSSAKSNSGSKNSTTTKPVSAKVTKETKKATEPTVVKATEVKKTVAKKAESTSVKTVDSKKTAAKKIDVTAKEPVKNIEQPSNKSNKKSLKNNDTQTVVAPKKSTPAKTATAAKTEVPVKAAPAPKKATPEKVVPVKKAASTENVEKAVAPKKAEKASVTAKPAPATKAPAPTKDANVTEKVVESKKAPVKKAVEKAAIEVVKKPVIPTEKAKPAPKEKESAKKPAATSKSSSNIQIKKTDASKLLPVMPSRPLPTPTPAVLRNTDKKPQIVIAHRKPVIEEKEEDAVVAPYQPEAYRSILDEPATPSLISTIYRYSDEELIEFRDLINNRIDAARKELLYLQGLITRKDEAGTEDTENRFNNIEDGSGAMEREQLSQLASRQIQFIGHLEKALMRIENKSYGVCRVTGRLIDKARLRAVPHATLSIEAKKMMSGSKN